LQACGTPDTDSIALVDVPMPIQSDSTSCGVIVMAGLAMLLASLPGAFGSFKIQGELIPLH
jgi:hypothetical protein